MLLCAAPENLEQSSRAVRPPERDAPPGFFAEKAEAPGNNFPGAFLAVGGRACGALVPLPQKTKKCRSKARFAPALVRLEGLEPPTYWFVANHSIQLSYNRRT